MTEAEARAALAAAFTVRDQATATLEAARKATGNAKGFLEEIQLEVARLDQASREVSTALGQEIAASLRAGERPAILLRNDNGAEREEAEGRLAAAKAAVAELVREEGEAEAVLEAAKEASEAARKSVVRAVAYAIARRADELEAEADALRRRLGLGGGFLIRYLQPAMDAEAPSFRHPVIAGTGRERTMRRQWPNVGGSGRGARI